MADTRPAPAQEDGDRRVSVADLLCGGVFVALGLGFAIGGSTYDVGSALRMGPGYIPLVLGSILTGLGLLIAGQAFFGGDPHEAELEEEQGPVPWRQGLFLVTGVVFFGATVRGLGLAPTLFVTTLMAALAGHRPRPLPVLATAAGLTALCLLVFVTLLQLRLPLLGPWLGG